MDRLALLQHDAAHPTRHWLLRLLLSLSMLVALILPTILYAANSNTLNIYTWSQEIPMAVIKQFEQETGIKVNHSTYDTNEIMYAKLKASKNTVYDIIEPSSYFIDHMRRQSMLEKLDKTKLPNLKHIDPAFTRQAYDFNNTYSVPLIWGVTGIFVNTHYLSANHLSRWADLLTPRYHNQLLLLDDPREVFSVALLMLGYSINDTDPVHIEQAYQKLRQLSPNIRLFNTDAVISILIDEDAMIGTAWNGDFFKAVTENKALQFIYPEDHFEIWVDNLAIPKNAPHLDQAYQFLNFMLRPDIAKQVSLAIGYSTANLTARNQLPPQIKNNPVLYPSPAIFERGEFETDTGEATFALLEKYWEKLKMGAG